MLPLFFISEFVCRFLRAQKRHRSQKRSVLPTAHKKIFQKMN